MKKTKRTRELVLSRRTIKSLSTTDLRKLAGASQDARALMAEPTDSCTTTMGSICN